MARCPGIAIVVAYVLVLTSIAMLVMYVHHIGRSLRVSALIELVGNDTRRLLDEHYPDRDSAPARRTPAVDLVDELGGGDVLRRRPARRDRRPPVTVCCTSLPALGSFVPAGAPLDSHRG